MVMTIAFFNSVQGIRFVDNYEVIDLEQEVAPG